MQLSKLARLPLIVAIAAALALVAAGCGGEKTDVSQGVNQFNTDILANQGASLDCPKEVDGGEGTTFDCKLKSTKDDSKSADVQLKIVKQGGNLAVQKADEAAFAKALAQVTS